MDSGLIDVEPEYQREVVWTCELPYARLSKYEEKECLLTTTTNKQLTA